MVMLICNFIIHHYSWQSSDTTEQLNQDKTTEFLKFLFSISKLFSLFNQDFSKELPPFVLTLLSQKGESPLLEAVA